MGSFALLPGRRGDGLDPRAAPRHCLTAATEWPLKGFWAYALQSLRDRSDRRSWLLFARVAALRASSAEAHYEIQFMKYNKYNAWTVALVSAGVVSLPAAARSEETATTNSVLTALSTTTISGYVDTSAHWNPGTGNANLPVYSPNGVPGGSKADGFNLDVVALTLSKPIGEP